MDGDTTAMTKQHFLKIFLLAPTLVFFLALASCVTVNLGSGKTTTAQGVSFNQPAKPFEPAAVKDADKAWQNKDNGNMISYLSTCNDSADPTLQAARGDFFNSVSNLKIIKENELIYNGREALATVAEGTVDGVKMRLELLLFKKNNCMYTLSYVALANSFNDNHEQYKQFAESFQAP